MDPVPGDESGASFRILPPVETVQLCRYSIQVVVGIPNIQMVIVCVRDIHQRELKFLSLKPKKMHF